MMFESDYPKVKLSLGQAALQEPYPAWLLDPQGIIRGANLMAFWLWDLIKPGEPIRPDTLLGQSIFQILSHHLERIPVEQNVEFYTKSSAVVKRVATNRESPLYSAFIAALKTDQRLAYIYEHAPESPDHEWEYALSIALPALAGACEYLEFHVTTFLLEGGIGFLVMHSPATRTLPVIEEHYSLLRRTYSNTVYSSPDTLEDRVEDYRPLAKLKSLSRVYYPTFIQDSLWYIIEENKAHQLLVGGSVVGMHFFELFFAPQLREWMGPIQETSAPRAVRYFDVFTADFLREEHELHARYEQVMKRLWQLPEFRNFLDMSRKCTIYINLPEQTEIPFYTCRVLLPWPLSQEITLHFRSLAQVLYKDLLVPTNRRYYRVILVPENNETEVALILLHLTSPASGLDHAEILSLKQFLWGLTILKTVREGLRRIDEDDTQWEPEDAFERHWHELEMRFSTSAKDTTDEILAESRSIIEELDEQGTVDRESLLIMLKSLADRQVALEQVRTFFTQALERYQVLSKVKK